jgi:polysaccharide pyruvyl transferase WcaK-like protein
MTNKMSIRLIETVLLRLGALAAAWLRLLLEPHSCDSLLVAPSSPGSLGDEAMLRGSVKELSGRGARRITILCCGAGERWHVDGPAVHQIFIPGLLGYGSARSLLKFCLLSARYRTIVFIGADCFDGGYGADRELVRLRLAGHAAHCALRVLISGFSFNRHPVTELVREIRALPEEVQFMPRDQFSLERFQSATGKAAVLSADIAFLLDPDGDSNQVRGMARWIVAQHNRGRIVVGLNLNQLFLRLVDDGERRMAALILALAQRDERLAFVLIPHDSRSADNDETLLCRLLDAVPGYLRDRFVSIALPESASAAKALAGFLDFLISQRMHLAIAALGCGVPVMCCEYQDKAEGMLAHFGQSEMVIRPGDFVDLEQLTGRILGTIRDRETLRPRIREALPRVLELARRNFG